MSNQGSASNYAGREFQGQLIELVEAHGYEFETEVRKYRDAEGVQLRHDILLTRNGHEWVIEAKWHGTARGSIGQKLAYTMLWMSELHTDDDRSVDSIIVVGGYWPARIVERVKRHAQGRANVRIMSETEFATWLATY